MLPKGVLPTRKVELSGGEVEVHGLTLAQSRIAGDLEGVDRVTAGISFGTATPKEDVEAWLETAPAGDVRKLIDAIMDVSGLSEGAQFQE